MFFDRISRIYRIFCLWQNFVADKKEPVNPANPVKKMIENVNIFSSKVLSSNYSNFSYISRESANTSLNDIRTAGALGLYPNPAKVGENVTLLKGGSNNEIGWQLLTIGGQVVGSGMINSTESSIPTSQLSSGIYLIKLTGNNRQAMQKLIIE